MSTLLLADLFAGLTTGQVVLLVMALAFGFYMAWNIGANDVANAMGTSVGSGALTLKWALVLAAVFEFSGAYFVGANVSETVRKGIFDPTLLSDPNILAVGMIGSLLAAGIWLQVASYFGWPVSTTHSIVGAVLGFGCVSAGVGAINWTGVDGHFGGVIKIMASWIISPLLAGTLAYLLFKTIQRRILNKPDPAAAARRLAPAIVFFVMLVMVGLTAFKALTNYFKQAPWVERVPAIDPTEPGNYFLLVVVGIAGTVGLIGAVFAWLFVDRVVGNDRAGRGWLETTQIKRRLDKARKHLGRIKPDADDTLKAKASALLTEVQALEKLTNQPAEVPTTRDQYKQVEKIFAYLQIISACFVAFAHGANDVANAIGPLSAAVQAMKQGTLAATADVPAWALLLGGAGIVFGLATWGWRVMQTIGKKITELTPTRGFCAEMAAAMTILIASLPFAWAKVPISTTHTLVGAVLGVGVARGIGAINPSTVRDIAASWVITIPAAAGLSIAIYFFLRAIFV